MEQREERLELIALNGEREGTYDIITLLNRARVIGVWRGLTREETAQLTRLEHQVCSSGQRMALQGCQRRG